MKTLKFNSESLEDKMVIIDESKIETKHLCKCYSDYGQVIGCYEAGCYSFDNSCSSFRTDLENYLWSQFSDLIDIELICNDIDSLKELLEDFENKAKIIEVAEKWILDNESHCEVTVYEYHDGHNWISLEIDGEDEYRGLSTIEDDLNTEILEAFENAEFSHFNQGRSFAETEKFSFEKSQWQGEFGYAYVTIK